MRLFRTTPSGCGEGRSLPAHDPKEEISTSSLASMPGNNSFLKDKHLSLRHVLSRFSSIRLCATPWTVAHQAPLSMGIL